MKNLGIYRGQNHLNTPYSYSVGNTVLKIFMKKEEDIGRWPCEDLLRVLSVSGDSEEAAFQTAATLKLQSDKPRFTGERQKEARTEKQSLLRERLCASALRG